jgi:hypothetical protein
MGVMFGVMLNISFPEVLIEIFLTVLLIFLVFLTGMKARRLYLIENAKMAAEKQK